MPKKASVNSGSLKFDQPMFQAGQLQSGSKPRAFIPIQIQDKSQLKNASLSEFAGGQHRNSLARRQILQEITTQ